MYDYISIIMYLKYLNGKKDLYQNRHYILPVPGKSNLLQCTYESSIFRNHMGRQSSSKLQYCIHFSDQATWLGPMTVSTCTDLQSAKVNCISVEKIFAQWSRPPRETLRRQ